MSKVNDNIVRKDGLDLKLLERISRRPKPYEGSEASLWTDPYVSSHVLHAHLDPDDDEASRRPHIIDASVRWIEGEIRRLSGPVDRASILDLGCGPGLYAQQLAAFGFEVTGIDVSSPCVTHARDVAGRSGLSIDYRTGDYLSIDLGGPYHAALVVYGGISELDPSDRKTLLGRVHEALVQDGVLIFDVVTRRYAERQGESDGWYVASRNGFWAPGRHLVLEQTFHYPREAAHLQRFLIILPDGTIRSMPLWRSYFSKDSVGTLLDDNGFEIDGLYSDLTGRPFDPESEWLGVVARRRSRSADEDSV